jgi:hypothetical protein
MSSLAMLHSIGHLAFQCYGKSYCKYYIDAALRFWKSKGLIQTWSLTNDIWNNHSSYEQFLISTNAEIMFNYYSNPELGYGIRAGKRK